MNHAASASNDLFIGLKAALVAQGAVHADANWKSLTGGRTNLVWSITGAGASMICKLSLEGRDTPLFPNSARAQGIALKALSGQGLAPEHTVELETRFGPCLLYPAVTGEPWRREVGVVGRTLAQLHQIQVPPELPRIPTDLSNILDTGKFMLRGSSHAPLMQSLRPEIDEIEAGPDVFLHGDPVPGNIITQPKGCVLIDWQCPGRGDAIHDLAIFLSPAMQTLGPGHPLDQAERNAFLIAYDDPPTVARLNQAEPALSWRMACYCLWRVAQGHADYTAAFDAELNHLQKLR